MADPTRLARAFVRAAILRATALGGGATPKSVLESLVLGQFTTTVQNGRTVLKTSEAGGEVIFHFPDNLTPSDVMGLAEEALCIVESSPDPTHPTVQTRRIKRLRASFAKGAF